MIFVIALFVGFAGFDTVDANHLGVKVKLGQLTGVMEPGLQWTGLFTQVYQYDLRIRKAQVDLTGGGSAVDKTGQAIYATINVNYRLKPSKDTVTELYKNVGSDDVIDDRLNLDAIIREGFKQATVKYDALEILDKRQEVKELAKENIHNNFPKEYFEIVDIVITNIDFSDNFKKAIEEKKTAEQLALKEQNQLEVVKFQQQQEIEKYKAEAEKLRLQKQEVSALLNQRQWIDKWDGHLPQFMMTSQDSVDMLMQLPTLEAGQNVNP
ncbi:MAG: prohibitin family protein [Candidatus Thorarchaeota archaeon]